MDNLEFSLSTEAKVRRCRTNFKLILSTFMKHSAVLGTVILATLHSFPAQADETLYRYGGWDIRDGKSGPVSQFQAGLNTVLAGCQSTRRLTTDGIFGKGTRAAIIEAATCESVSHVLDADSPARVGAITTQLWTVVMPDSLAPTIDQRAASLKLTFEATDYDQMQWNFCQSRPLYRPAIGQTECHSNDKHSYITWGPNGATAGWGREVQAILNQFLSIDGNDKHFDKAFASEASALRRMLKLKDAMPNGPLETYLCGVWMSSDRRSVWEAGFRTLGQYPDVRSAYRKIYGSTSFDAGKIASFYNIWRSEEFGLPVSEIDHAFFIDRAAHMGMSRTTRDKVREALRELKKSAGSSWPLSSAQIRRHISKRVLPGSQSIRTDRLGRDVAYFIDGIGLDRLNDIEVDAWTNRGRRNAVDLGLSDSRFMPIFVPSPIIHNPMPAGGITEEEAALCPAAVLNPK